MKQLFNSIQTQCEQLGIDLNPTIVLQLVKELGLNPNETTIETEDYLISDEIKINGTPYLILQEEEADDLAVEKVYDMIEMNGVCSTSLNPLDYLTDEFIESLSHSLVRTEVKKEMDSKTINHYLTYYQVETQEELIECLAQDKAELAYIQSKMADEDIIFFADLRNEIQTDVMAIDLLEIMGRGSQLAYDGKEIQFKVDKITYCAYLID